MKYSFPLHIFSLILAICCFSLNSQAQQRTIKTDALEIMFITNFTGVYSDHGTGAHGDVSVWKAVLPPGFSALGHYAKSGYGAPQTVMIAVRGVDPSAVAFPVDYKWIYNDSGTGGDMDGSFWEPVPPPGYRAMGTVAMGSHGKPSLQEVVCVRNDLTTFASVGKFIWNDGGSGGDYDISVWQIKPPAISQNSKESFITSGSFCAHRSYGALTNSEAAYAIKLKMPSDNKNINLEKPRLTSTAKPAEKTEMKLASVAYLPCISVNDGVFANNVAKQVRETPIYTLERYDYYSLQDFNTSYSNNDGEMTFSYTTGMTKAQETSITETFETSGTVETGFYGVNVSVTVSYALDQTNTYSTEDMQEKTLEKQFPVPGNGAGALYTLSHLYKLKRANGQVIDSWTMNTKYAHFTDFSPQKEKASPPSNPNPTSIPGNSNRSPVRPTPPPSHTAAPVMPVSLNQIRGTYVQEPYENDWHEGTISGENLVWTNVAGASWGLQKQAISASQTEVVFQTDQNNPYYQNGFRTFNFVIEYGQVVGFYFANGFYSRISEEMNSGKQSLSEDLAGSRWGYHYQGHDFDIRFGQNGKMELLSSWEGVQWQEISENEVELYIPGSDRHMILNFDYSRTSFNTVDWDGSETSGFRK